MEPQSNYKVKVKRRGRGQPNELFTTSQTNEFIEKTGFLSRYGQVNADKNSQGQAEDSFNNLLFQFMQGILLSPIIENLHTSLSPPNTTKDILNSYHTNQNFNRLIPLH